MFKHVSYRLALDVHIYYIRYVYRYKHILCNTYVYIIYLHVYISNMIIKQALTWMCSRASFICKVSNGYLGFLSDYINDVIDLNLHYIIDILTFCWLLGTRYSSAYDYGQQSRDLLFRHRFYSILTLSSRGPRI